MAPVPYTATYAHQSHPLKHRVSKRGAMGNVADSVVPHHSHGAGGVLNLDEPRIKARSNTTLDEIARRVRVQSDRFQQALLPAAESLKLFAESSPVLFTFLTIFIALSAIPTLIFIGFVTSVAVFSTGLSVIVLLFSVAGTIMFGLTFLLPVLAITGTIAVVCVSVLLCVFLAHRLYLHLVEASESHDGVAIITAGIVSWWDETRARVGMGSYKYGVSAFEDPKAYGSPRSARQATQSLQNDEVKLPRIVYEHIDYSKNHPQPTPSFPGSKTVKIEREDPFVPEAADALVIKREHYDGDWTDDDDAAKKN